MALNFTFNFGRLLGKNERITTAKVNAIAKGISASLTGSVGTGDLADGAVTPAKFTPGAYSYATAARAGGVYNATFVPAVAAYTDGMMLAIKVDLANLGGCSLNAGPGAKALRLGGSFGVLTAGWLQAGSIVSLRYNSTALGGGGCFEIVGLVDLPAGYLESNKLAADAVAPLGHYSTLTMANNAGTPNSKVDVTVTDLVLKDATGLVYLLAAPGALTADITVLGAINGLDTGAEANSTWYYVWVIWNGATAASLLSISATAPTLPATYTHKALVGAIYNGAGGNFATMYQYGNQVLLADTATPVAATTGPAVYTSVSLAAVVPPQARLVQGRAISTGTFQTVSLAADNTGLGLVKGTVQTGAPGAQFSFRLGLKTAQTFFWLPSGADVTAYSIFVSGYWWVV